VLCCVVVLCCVLTKKYFSMKECGMFAETRVFIEQAEKVENWNHEELLQAGRNVWTCFGLQMILYQQNVTMSDAYLGYSLLYPYTDNYLDDDTITPNDKKTFQDLFTRRLAGEHGEEFLLAHSLSDLALTHFLVKARSEAEQKIWDCVTMVESKYLSLILFFFSYLIFRGKKDVLIGASSPMPSTA